MLVEAPESELAFILVIKKNMLYSNIMLRSGNAFT